MEVGSAVYIKYTQQDSWLVRRLLDKVGDSVTKFIILTPEEDVYLKDFIAANDDIDVVQQGVAFSLQVDSGVSENTALVTVTVHDESVVIAAEQIQKVSLLEWRKINEVGDDGETDLYVFPITRDQRNSRYRCFNDSVDLWDQVSFKDCSAAGPMTVQWCGRVWSERNGAVSHREWWKNTTRLGIGDYVVTERESLMWLLQEAVEYDQWNGVNLCCMEHTLRRAQLIDYLHQEKWRVDASGKDRAIIDIEEHAIFTGSHIGDGNINPALALTGRVGKGMHRIGTIDKQASKAREERALERK